MAAVERHPPLDGHLLRLPHLPHAPLAEQLHQLVAAQLARLLLGLVDLLANLVHDPGQKKGQPDGDEVGQEHIAQLGARECARPQGVGEGRGARGDGVNDRLAIDYELFLLPDPIPVALNIYDLQGRRRAPIEVGVQSAGLQQLFWDGRDERGPVLAPGLYLLDIELAAEFKIIRNLRPVGVAY